MKCINCGTELSDELSFCTNCGTPLAVSDAAQVTGQGNLGASLASAVEANQGVMDEINSHGEIADQAAARWAEGAPVSGAQPEAPAGYQPPSYGQSAAAGVAAAAGAASAPFYQQDASPSAHYSSQRSYENNPYGQNTGAPEPPSYQQPSYSQPAQQAQQETWAPQPATSRALAMVLYVSGLLGLIFALVVRDKDDEFITHHLNNNVVIVIGVLVGSLLSAIFIGVILLIYMIVMAIMGIVSAYNGDMKELPLIGKIHIIK